jgi:hypothetical protein
MPAYLYSCPVQVWIRMDGPQTSNHRRLSVKLQRLQTKALQKEWIYGIGVALSTSPIGSWADLWFVNADHLESPREDPDVYKVQVFDVSYRLKQRRGVYEACWWWRWFWIEIPWRLLSSCRHAFRPALKVVQLTRVTWLRLERGYFQQLQAKNTRQPYVLPPTLLRQPSFGSDNPVGTKVSVLPAYPLIIWIRSSDGLILLPPGCKNLLHIWRFTEASFNRSGRSGIFSNTQ